jgi:hypothetical protein
MELHIKRILSLCTNKQDRFLREEARELGVGFWKKKMNGIVGVFL